ncbi:MAG: CvpA family protein [Spirochaetes bacterium]|nr:MAG: CvpA family protein [Spirochaetota bacterium]
MHIVAFDIVSLVVILIMAVRAVFRGFIDEFLSMAAVILGLAAALLFTGKVTVLVDKYIHSEFWNPVVAFLLLFLAVYIVVKILENVLNSLIEKVQLEKLDQSLGFFLGIIEGVIVVVLIVFLLEIQPFIEIGSLFKDSIAYQAADRIIPLGKELLESRAQ